MVNIERGGAPTDRAAFPLAQRWMMRVAGVQLFIRLRSVGGPVGRRVVGS